MSGYWRALAAQAQGRAASPRSAAAPLSLAPSSASDAAQPAAYEPASSAAFEERPHGAASPDPRAEPESSAPSHPRPAFETDVAARAPAGDVRPREAFERPSPAERETIVSTSVTHHVVAESGSPQAPVVRPAIVAPDSRSPRAGAVTASPVRPAAAATRASSLAARAEERDGGRAPAPAAPAAPDVHIHIGRVELTALTSPAAAPRTRTPAAAQPQSLDDYLRGKRRR